MKLILTCTLILLLSSCFVPFQGKDKKVEFKVVIKNEYYVNKLKCFGFALNDNNYLGFTIEGVDSKTGEWIKELLHFSKTNNWVKEIISKTDMSDGFYSDTLLFFKDSCSEKQVIMWKKEGEYWSYIDIYLFQCDTIKLIGDISIGVACENCDSFNFPERDILVKGSKDEIEVVFRGKSIYQGSECQNVPYHSVGIKTEKLVLTYDGTKSEISY